MPGRCELDAAVVQLEETPLSLEPLIAANADPETTHKYARALALLDYHWRQTHIAAPAAEDGGDGGPLSENIAAGSLTAGLLGGDASAGGQIVQQLSSSESTSKAALEAVIHALNDSRAGGGEVGGKR